VSDVRDVLILGAGPAGYTAALYAARANLKPLLISGWQPGGQLTMTTDVENYPGFEHGIMGPELMDIMKKQVERFGTEVVSGAVERVDFSKRPFTVWTDEGKEYRGQTVIIATGASAKLLNIPSETKFMGFGVSACATCDGPFFKNKKVMVVGGGDTAMEEATYLTRLVSEVIVVHRRDTLRASKIMQDRALANPKIRILWNSEIAEVLGSDQPKVSGVKVRNLVSGEITEHTIDGLFVAIGHQPNTTFLKGVLPMDEQGYLKVEPGTPRTSIPGVFAAGDVYDRTYRQAVTAAGSGCMAAIEAERWLEAQSHREKHEAAKA
jgi:thioredoxin reductase (NADPH)